MQSEFHIELNTEESQKTVVVLIVDNMNMKNSSSVIIVTFISTSVPA